MSYTVAILTGPGGQPAYWATRHTPEEACQAALRQLHRAANSADPPPAPQEEERRGPTAGVSSEKGGDTQ